MVECMSTHVSIHMSSGMLVHMSSHVSIHAHVQASSLTEALDAETQQQQTQHELQIKALEDELESFKDVSQGLCDKVETLETQVFTQWPWCNCFPPSKSLPPAPPPSCIQMRVQ